MTIENFFLFIAAAAAISLSVSCNKSSSGTPSFMGSNTLSGTWEIRDMWGPLIDIDPNAFKPGNGNTWSFINSTFEQRTKESVYNSGTYTTDDSGINPDGNKPVHRFIFNGIPSESFEIRNDSLYVYSTRSDDYRYTSVYIRLNYIY